MTWQSLFQPHILNRGYNYYIDQRVDITSTDNNRIVAEVDGSETYTVAIEVSGDRIMHMDCNCPYATNGKYCKHMAAVLFKYYDVASANDYTQSYDITSNDHTPQSAYNITMPSDVKSNSSSNPLTPSDSINIPHTTPYTPSPTQEAEHLLNLIPADELHALLVKLLASDSSLRNNLRLQYDFCMDAEQMLLLRHELNDIVDAYSERGYIDWHNAFSFCCVLIRFVDDRIELLIEKGALYQAFELNNQIFRIIGTIDMDDSDGGSAMVANRCYDVWKKIYNLSGKDDQTKIRAWFFAYEEGSLLDWIEEYLVEFREIELATSEQLLSFIEELDEMLDARANSTDCGYVYSIRGGSCSVIERRIEYMRRLGCSQNDIDEFCYSRRNFYIARNIIIDNAISRGDLRDAVELILDGRKCDKGNKAHDEHYSELLIDLYKMLGDSNKYIDELRYNLLNCNQKDAEHFRELKACIEDPDEWSAIADEIITKQSNSYSVYELLLEEKRYDQMMDMLEENMNFFKMDEYFDVLSKVRPERVVDFYARLVRSEMKRASDRKHYRHLVEYLNKMSFYPEGKTQARDIAASWREEYRRRSALMDELERTGF